MSIIYEALQKIEETNQEKDFQINVPTKEDIPQKGKSRILNFRLFILLGILIVLSLNYFLFMSKKEKVPYQSYKFFSGQQTSLSTESTANPKKLSFVEKFKTKAKASSYVLEGVVFDESSPFAIINGKLLRQSDQIGDFVLTEIREDSARLTSYDKSITLDLNL